MATEKKLLITMAGVAAVSFFPLNNANAVTLVNSEEWTRFTFDRVGLPPVDTYRFIRPSETKGIYSLKVTDAGLIGDELSISVKSDVKSDFLGNTSSVATGGTCGFAPDMCFSTASSGIFYLPNSNQSDISIISTQNAVRGLGGAGFLRIDPLQVLAKYEFSSDGIGFGTKPTGYALLPASEILPDKPGIFSIGGYVIGTPVTKIDPSLEIKNLSSLSDLGTFESVDSILANSRRKFAAKEEESIITGTDITAKFSPAGETIGLVSLGGRK